MKGHNVLHSTNNLYGWVAKLADATDLKSVGGKHRMGSSPVLATVECPNDGIGRQQKLKISGLYGVQVQILLGTLIERMAEC